jgi:hypothetical protein
LGTILQCSKFLRLSSHSHHQTNLGRDLYLATRNAIASGIVVIESPLFHFSQLRQVL